MEIQNNPNYDFKSIDINADGKLSRSEMKKAESIFGEGFFKEAEDDLTEPQFLTYLVNKLKNTVESSSKTIEDMRRSLQTMVNQQVIKQYINTLASIDCQYQEINNKLEQIKSQLSESD